MSDCYVLTIGPSQSHQSGTEESFIGGTPNLPKGMEIPRCKLCAAEQTFFFQITFPSKHLWEGMTLALFACTSCADRNHLIPEMLSGPLPGADIPEGFLLSYQTNLRILVFEKALGAPRTTYQNRVIFKPLSLHQTANMAVDDNKIGGTPAWLLEDESPKSYAGKLPMFFLLQLQAGLQFEIDKHAPSQVEVGLDGSPEPSPFNYYQLFIGNKIFLFGTQDRTEPRVYAITQVE